MGDSLSVVRGFPEAVREEVGYALYLAQIGAKHPKAKPLKGIGAGVLEVVSDHHGDTYRAVYTVKLRGRIYVLHAFIKKSKKGIATPKPDLEVVRQRLRRALELHSKRGD
ncbi:MAG: type II toxin-antitoxin system RelE/ParE family toxin [Candidatus Acidiferrales bacterium]